MRRNNRHVTTSHMKRYYVIADNSSHTYFAYFLCYHFLLDLYIPVPSVGYGRMVGTSEVQDCPQLSSPGEVETTYQDELFLLSRLMGAATSQSIFTRKIPLQLSPTDPTVSSLLVRVYSRN